jgi:hypothetical protein
MSQLSRLFAAAMGMALVSCATSSHQVTDAGRPVDLAFLPQKPEKGAVFAMYNYHGTALRRNNWTSRLDLTGVSWNDPRTATAVSRNHVVMAAHFIRPSEVPLIFHDRAGNRHVRTLAAVQALTSVGDIAIGRLNQPLPPGVKHYRFAGQADAVPMKLVFVTDQKMTVSLHRLGQAGAGRVVLGYDPKIPKTYWRNLVVGDSGNPAFIERDGELLLLTTFTTGGPGTGPFYGEPAVREAVMAAIGTL